MSITDLSHLFSTSYVDLKLGKEPHKIELLLTTPHRSGLQRHWRLLCRLLTSEVRSEAITGLSVRLGPLSASDTSQSSQGKFMTFRCTTTEFTPLVLDGDGLRDLTLTRPTEAPHIQFLFVGSHL